MRFLVLAAIVVTALKGQKPGNTVAADFDGAHFSEFRQITPANVVGLKLSWSFRTAHEVTPVTPAPRNPAGGNGGGPIPEGRVSEVSPVVVNGIMYLATPYNYVVCLDAATGREVWRYEHARYGASAVRGLSYWPGDINSPPEIFFGTTSGYLIALNAKTGRPMPTFADDGILNLRRGVTEEFPHSPYGVSSPPAIWKNLVITGSSTQEAPSFGPSGDIRAWDVHTGKLIWTFHSIPRPGEANFRTWTGDTWEHRSGTNVWGTISVDSERGLVFLPFGSPTPDYQGGDRPGANLYSDSLVALDAATGKMRWYFQTTHHDLWDYDLTAPPALIDIVVAGMPVPAIAQMTKQALLFVLDRTNGKPVYGVEERPVPQTGFADDEKPWPIQPFPLRPPVLARNSFNIADLANIVPQHRKFCEELLNANGGASWGGPYIPINGNQPAVLFPSMIGGGLWGGVSYDKALGYIFVNTQSLGFIRSGPWFWDPVRRWPCNKPPWGELYAINARNGTIAWRVPFGDYPELTKLGIAHAGTPNIGGTRATAGGIVFAAGTLDNKFRAYDSRTGKELWSAELPAAAHAVPVSYLGKDGKQYVAIMVSGGGFLRDPIIPATLMAYALPSQPAAKSVRYTKREQSGRGWHSTSG